MAQRPALPSLCLRAGSRTGQKHSTVLFQDSAIMVAKTTRFALKNLILETLNLRLQLSLTLTLSFKNGFLCFSSDDVFSCAATCGDGGACARARSQAQSHSISTKARRAKDISRGVFYVFVNNRNFSHLPF